MSKKSIFAVALVSVTLAAGLSVKTFASSNTQSQIQITGDASSEAYPELAHEWYFIGCVHRSHDCHHEAHERGYAHYRAEYDHHSCDHHHPYACYGAY